MGWFSASYKRLEAVLGRPVAVLGRLASVLGRLGGVLGYLGTILAPSWGDLGASGWHLGAILGPLRVSWGRLGGVLGTLGGQDPTRRRAFWRPSGLAKLRNGIS